MDQLPQRVRRIVAVRRLSNPVGAVRWARKCCTTTPRSRPSPRRCNGRLHHRVWTSGRPSRRYSPMQDDSNQADSALRPGEVAISLPTATDAGVYFIGTIRTPWQVRSECPKRGAPDGPICSIVVDERWRDALTDMARHKRIQVLYWMHKARRDLVLQTPFRTGQTTGSPRCARRCGQTRSHHRSSNWWPSRAPRSGCAGSIAGRHAAHRPEARTPQQRRIVPPHRCRDRPALRATLNRSCVSMERLYLDRQVIASAAKQSPARVVPSGRLLRCARNDTLRRNRSGTGQ